MTIEPKSSHLKIYLARLHSMNQRPDKTVKLIEEAIQIDQDNDSLYHSLAIAYISIDQLDSAINAMEKGKYAPSTILALKLARFFEKTVDEIFTLEETD